MAYHRSPDPVPFSVGVLYSIRPGHMKKGGFGVFCGCRDRPGVSPPPGLAPQSVLILPTAHLLSFPSIQRRPLSQGPIVNGRTFRANPRRFAGFFIFLGRSAILQIQTLSSVPTLLERTFPRLCFFFFFFQNLDHSCRSFSPSQHPMPRYEGLLLGFWNMPLRFSLQTSPNRLGSIRSLSLQHDHNPLGLPFFPFFSDTS